ncbi:hypothetical protein P43SY_000832 [Pythium insidiosum]|uniref:Glutathione peroxidase n=1 Tax=Pythium insidiosum TaxID=114742 RepID=A0AAD5M8E3_PYTIN|nr:hypothetical protein P43SY_000832 [Pythium insidiosum]
MPTHIHGRVFARREQFSALPEELQEEAKACEAMLVEKKDAVFGSHHASLVRTVLSVRARQLVEVVGAWLEEKRDEKPSPEAVKTLIDAMVLHGFLVYNKEAEVTPKSVLRDSELFLPVEKEISGEASTSVWDLVDGVTFAASMKRKAGLLAPFTQGKDVYLMVNETLKTCVLFDFDTARAPIVEFNGPTGTFVAFDHSHFVHGVKIWNSQSMELINAEDKREQEALVGALVGIGMQYREAATMDLDVVKSIYMLKDVDIDGNEVQFETYKGKVLLIVNVASNCGLASSNYAELVQLHERYHAEGLEILAFPCNQFGGQEPGTSDEIKAFVAGFKCEFRFFQKGDVNGPGSREVFSFLKARLPGASGSYIKWNFTKFLIDRNGQPAKRFAPTDSPLLMEDDISDLLAATPEPEAAEVATQAAVVTTEEAVEAEVAAVTASEKAAELEVQKTETSTVAAGDVGVVHTTQTTFKTCVADAGGEVLESIEEVVVHEEKTQAPTSGKTGAAVYKTETASEAVKGVGVSHSTKKTFVKKTFTDADGNVTETVEEVIAQGDELPQDLAAGKTCVAVHQTEKTGHSGVVHTTHKTIVKKTHIDENGKATETIEEEIVSGEEAANPSKMDASTEQPPAAVVA